ncbi:hypothetical protein GA0070563_10945 [Micromonospora carbonacea]|uniref:Uncharacterized protein n=1 Tax=Micromonospora carbonacea TaxID=47853 RepID=A0A1C4ZNX8_9ACTN|nr:hypothetical protein GA0070563_10945 [Micromonospora carbonacea]
MRCPPGGTRPGFYCHASMCFGFVANPVCELWNAVGGLRRWRDGGGRGRGWPGLGPGAVPGAGRPPRGIVIGGNCAARGASRARLPPLPVGGGRSAPVAGTCHSRVTRPGPAEVPVHRVAGARGPAPRGCAARSGAARAAASRRATAGLSGSLGPVDRAFRAPAFGMRSGERAEWSPERRTPVVGLVGRARPGFGRHGSSHHLRAVVRGGGGFSRHSRSGGEGRFHRNNFPPLSFSPPMMVGNLVPVPIRVARPLDGSAGPAGAPGRGRGRPAGASAAVPPPRRYPGQMFGQATICRCRNCYGQPTGRARRRIR